MLNMEVKLKDCVQASYTSQIMWSQKTGSRNYKACDQKCYLPKRSINRESKDNEVVNLQHLTLCYYNYTTLHYKYWTN